MSPKGADRALSMSPSPFVNSEVASKTAHQSDDDEYDSSSALAPPFKISLWLLPPDEGGVRSHLQSSIDEIAAMTGGPSFVPHATILGGIPCLCSTEEDAERWADALLQELRSVLPSVGGIECRFGRDQGRRPCCVFEDGNILVGKETDQLEDDAVAVSSSCVKWNQSAVSIFDRTSAFGKAVELTYRAVCKTDEALGGGTVPLPSEGEIDAFDWTTTLKPPLCQPHYSHAYGNHPDLVTAKRQDANAIGKYVVDLPPDFVSTEAMLIWSWPASLEGVPTWREIGKVQLC